MSASRLLKFAPFLILSTLNLNALSAHAANSDGGTSGGGGDAATEMRVDEIRADILKWIHEGGASGLKLSGVNTYENYISKMEELLLPHAVVIGAVSTKQEAETTDPEQKVIVDGEYKTCRSFISTKDGLPHILCNTERFAATGESDQYRLIHHEYAGTAGLELNIGASSDYTISSQITSFLVPETILKLAVKRPSSVNISLTTDSEGCRIEGHAKIESIESANRANRHYKFTAVNLISLDQSRLRFFLNPEEVREKEMLDNLRTAFFSDTEVHFTIYKDKPCSQLNDLERFKQFGDDITFLCLSR